FQITIARDLADQIERTEEGNAVLDQRTQCARKLRVITMANHTAVTRNRQSKAVPRQASFFSAHECAETNTRANDNQDGQPPISDNAVMNLHQDARGQWKCAPDLRHEAGQL